MTNNKPPAEALKELQAESEKLGLYEDEAVEGKELSTIANEYLDKNASWITPQNRFLAGQVFRDVDVKVTLDSDLAMSARIQRILKVEKVAVLDRVLEEFGKFVEDDSKVFTNGGTRYTPGIHSSYRVLKQIITKLKGE